MSKVKKSDVADDIALIKDILLQSEQQPVIASWAFGVWAAVMLGGAGLHFYFVRYLGMTDIQVFVRMWIPFQLLAIGAESFAYFVKSSDRSVPVLSGAGIRLFFAETVMYAGLISVIFFLLHEGYHDLLPGIMTIILAFFFLLPAQMSFYVFLSYFSIAGVSAGLLMLIFRVPANPGIPAALAFYGLLLACAGFIARHQERGNCNKGRVDRNNV